MLTLTYCGARYTKVNSGQVSQTISCGAFCPPPSISYLLPDDPCRMGEQQLLNCFAWKNFIALNWIASNQRGVPDTSIPDSAYGTPDDFRNTVWESYVSIDNAFNNSESNSLAYSPDRIKKIHDVNKVGSTAHEFDREVLTTKDNHLNAFFQAEGTWLTDQSGQLVWYEIRINPIEYDFIKANQLYDWTTQKKYATENKGIWNPTGSIEIKAAWRAIDESHLDSLKEYYKISQAMVPEVLGFKDDTPILGEYKQQYLALVGLHIIHKTSLAQQFIWMTFEHKYNAPTQGEIDPNIQYTFFDKNSKNLINNSPKPNKDKLTDPVQVVRIKQNALTPQMVTLNRQIHDMIRESNPKSVWQYYDLINVQWPQNSVNQSDNNQIVPLKEGGITPSNIANTTLETYIQSTDCISCHKYANVDNTNWATDYSFIYLELANKIKNSAKP